MGDCSARLSVSPRLINAPRAGPRGSKFALRSKLAEQTHGAAGDPSVSLLLLAASSGGGGLS